MVGFNAFVSQYPIRLELTQKHLPCVDSVGSFFPHFTIQRREASP